MRVFISYRRDDNPYLAEALHARLRDKFGSDHVFFDTVSIHGGEDFDRRIRSRIAWCDVVVALIGRHWGVSPGGRNWIADELNLARQLGRLVLPVWEDLVGDVPAYPSELSWMANMNGIPIHSGRSQSEIADLPGRIETAYRDYLLRRGMRADLVDLHLLEGIVSDRSDVPSTPTAPTLAVAIGLHGSFGYTPWLAGVMAEVIDFTAMVCTSAAYERLRQHGGVDEVTLDLTWGASAGGLVAVLGGVAASAGLAGTHVEDQVIALADIEQLLGSPSERTDDTLFRARDYLEKHLRECVRRWLSTPRASTRRCHIVTTSTAEPNNPTTSGMPCVIYTPLVPGQDVNELTSLLIRSASASMASPMIFGRYEVDTARPAGFDLATAAAFLQHGEQKSFKLIGDGARWPAGAQFVHELVSRDEPERPIERHFVVADPGRAVLSSSEFSLVRTPRPPSPPPDLRLLTAAHDDWIARERHRLHAFDDLAGSSPEEIVTQLRGRAADPKYQFQRLHQLAESTAAATIVHLTAGGTASPPLPLIYHDPVPLASVLRQELRAEMHRSVESHPEPWDRGPLSLWQHASETARWIDDLLVTAPVNPELSGAAARTHGLLRVAGALTELQQLVVWRIATTERAGWAAQALADAGQIAHSTPSESEKVVGLVQALDTSAPDRRSGLDAAVLALAITILRGPPPSPEGGFALVPALWDQLWAELRRVSACVAAARGDGFEPRAWPNRPLELRALDIAGDDAPEVLRGIVSALGSGLAIPGQSRRIRTPLSVAPAETEDQFGGLMGPRMVGLASLLTRRWRTHDVMLGRLDAARVLEGLLIDRCRERGTPIPEGRSQASRHDEIIATYRSRVLAEGHRSVRRRLADAGEYRVGTERWMVIPRRRRQAIGVRLATSAARVVYMRQRTDRRKRSGWGLRLIESAVVGPTVWMAAPSLTLLALAVALASWVLGSNDGLANEWLWTTRPGSQLTDSSLAQAALLLLGAAVVLAIAGSRPTTSSFRRAAISSWPILVVFAATLVAVRFHVRLGWVALSLVGAGIATLFTSWATRRRRWLPPAVAGLVHLIVLGTSKSIDGLTTASGPLIVAQTLSIAAVGFLAVTYDLFPERTTEPAPGDLGGSG